MIGTAPKSKIYISNISEDVWSFIDSMSPHARQTEIDENAQLSDRDLLSCSSWKEATVIVPQAVDPDFLSYYQETFGYAKIEILVPSQHTGEICHDVLQDEAIMSRLMDISQNSVLELTSYSSTYQFLDLVSALEKRGAQVTTPESPLKNDYWTTNFFGSKAGFRQLVATKSAQLPTMKMSEGYITFGIQDTAKIATDMYYSGGAVIKITKGHSGMGVMIIPPQSLSADQTTCEQEILNKLKAEKYWSKFPTIVERFINVDKTVGGGNPNIELCVDPDGSVRPLYFCGMRITKEGVFKGVEIHKSVLSAPLVKMMTEIGQFVGQQYASQGYRGYFDIDCVMSTDGELFLAESNVRKTGGTHVYHAVKTLVGENFMSDVFAVSQNLYTLPTKKPMTFANVLTTLKPILFDHKKKEGVVLASASLLKQQKIAYVVIGPNQARTLEIESRMEQLLAEF